MNTLYEKIETLVINKAKSIYGNVLPKKVQERLDWELGSIEKNDTATYLWLVQELVKELETFGHHTFVRGTTACSFVLFLLEITEINPLIPHYVCPECHYSEFLENEFCGVDLEDKNCPKCGKPLSKDGYNLPAEFLFGAEGETKPCIYINVSPEICDKLEYELKNLTEIDPSVAESVKVFPQNEMLFLEKLESLTGKKVKEIPLDDSETLTLMKQIKTNGVNEFYTDFVKSIMSSTSINGYDDLIRIIAMSHGTDVWIYNASDLISDKKATLKEVITSTDDIMIYLMKKGIERKIAFNIAEKLHQYKELESSELELMKNNGVPDWYIESCKKIRYLFPRAHAASYVLTSYREAYYKAHYPLEFYCAYLSMNVDEITFDMITNDIEEISAKISKLSFILHDEYNALGSELHFKVMHRNYILSICEEMLEAGIEFASELAWEVFDFDKKILSNWGFRDNF